MKAHIDDLPAFCASRLPITGAPIILSAGDTGYWPAPEPNFDVEEFNAKQAVTQAQRLAMEIGSIFGFDVPGSDPQYHLNTPTTAMRTTTKLTKAALRKRAKAIRGNAYYQHLRERGYGAWRAMKAVIPLE